jgi:hypothetical protein
MGTFTPATTREWQAVEAAAIAALQGVAPKTSDHDEHRHSLTQRFQRHANIGLNLVKGSTGPHIHRRQPHAAIGIDMLRHRLQRRSQRGVSNEKQAGHDVSGPIIGTLPNTAQKPQIGGQYANAEQAKRGTKRLCL